MAHRWRLDFPLLPAELVVRRRSTSGGAEQAIAEIVLASPVRVKSATNIEHFENTTL